MSIARLLRRPGSGQCLGRTLARGSDGTDARTCSSVEVKDGRSPGRQEGRAAYRERVSPPLEPTGEELRALFDAVADRAVRVVAALPDAPASNVDGLAALLADPALRRAPA